MDLDLSVVIAVYNEHPRNLLVLLERLWKSLNPLNLTYEVIFVNDGSGLVTSKALAQIASEVDYVKLVVLSRNFGQQAAITAGINEALGRAVVNLDSDCQDPPELIPKMIEKWKEGYDVVYARRSTRRDRVTKRLPAYLFYRLLGSISSVDIPWDTGDFRLMDKKVVRELCQLPEKTRFLRGLIPWLGFKQFGIAIDRDARAIGETAYNLRKLLTLAMDGLLSFSVVPLYTVPIIGIVLIAVGVLALLVCWVADKGNLLATPVAFVFSALLLVAGIQVVCTGIVAAYCAKIIDEVRGRPTYVVSERLGLMYGQNKEQSDSRSYTLDQLKALEKSL